MFWTVTKALLEGMSTALELFFLTLLFAIPLGLVISFGSMSKWMPFRRFKKSEFRPLRKLFIALSKWKPLGGLKNCKFTLLRKISPFRPISALTNAVVWIFRGTPLMLQLIIIFYGPGMWFDNNIWAFSEGRMAACVVAFVINYACYFSVIFRGGIEGVPVGQNEAGEVLGMTKTQIFFKVTLLQMVKRVLPPMSNEIITLVKDTSLARIIAIAELIKVGEGFMKSQGITWPLFYTAVYYLLLVGILTIVFNLFERKLNYFR